MRLDPAKTHAIVVGVENYAAGESWNLDGPIKDALEVRQWLLDREVPANQIHTLLSPTDGDMPNVDDTEVIPPTSNEFGDVVNVVHESKGDLLVFFWAGHGIVGTDQQRRLFYADATVDDKRNLDIDSLLRSLRTSYFSGFPRQIVLIDACANYAEEMQWAFELPGRTFPSGDAMAGHEQFVLFAARSGQVAKNLGDEARGLFSRELLQELQSSPTEVWPPDMQHIAGQVQEEFAALRSAGKAAQTPIYLWSRDWDGSSIQLKAAAQPKPDHPEPAQPWKLTSEQLFGLTDHLLACDVMTDRDQRDYVVGQLRPEIANMVKRNAAARIDVLGIVKTSAGYSGGLEELLEAVHFLEQNSTAWKSLQQYAAELLGRANPERGPE